MIGRTKNNRILKILVATAAIVFGVLACYTLINLFSQSKSIVDKQNSAEGIVQIGSYSVKDQVKNATGVDGNNLEDTSKRIRVKSTIVESTAISDDSTIDSTMGDLETASSSMLAQTETTATLYDYGNDSNYVAYLDNVSQSGFVDGGIKDVAFARDNYNGEVVSGITFDWEKGVAYVPKVLVDNYVPKAREEEQGNVLQAQVMYTADRDNAGDVFLQSATIKNETTGESIDTFIGSEIWGDYSYIQLVDACDAMSLSSEDIKVSINDGAIFVDSETSTEVSYNNKTGWLRVANNALGIGNATISISSSKAKIASNDVVSIKANVSQMGFIKDENGEEIKFGNSFDIAGLFNYYANAGTDWRNYCFYVGGSYGTTGTARGYCVYVPSSAGDGTISGSEWVALNSSSTDYITVDEAYSRSGAQSYHIEFDNSIKNLGSSWDGLHVPNNQSDYAGVPTGQVWDATQKISSSTKSFAFSKNYSYSLYRAVCAHVSQVAAHEVSNQYLLMAKLVDVNLTEGSVTISFAAGGKSSQTCVMVAKFRANSVGKLAIQKESRIPQLTNNNPNYSRAGAIYGIYTDAGCTIRAHDVYGNESGIITDENGYGEAQNLAIGKYWIKEITASPNFQPDPTPYETDTRAGETVKTLSSEPFNYGFIELQKKSANESITNGNQCYSLAGAKFGIFRDAACTDKILDITTNENGYATTKGVIDENGNPAEHNFVFGDYWVKEISAPAGYSEETTAYPVSFSKTDENGCVKSVNYDRGGIVEEIPQSCTVDLLLAKVDSETSLSLPQGSASLAGAQFKVTYYDVQGFGDHSNVGIELVDTIVKSATTVKTWTFETDDKGEIYLNDSYKIAGDEFYKSTNSVITMPIGTIVIEEILAPEGYLNSNEGKCWVRSITAQGSSEHINTYNSLYADTAVEEQVVRGDLEFVKVAEDSGARLSNIPFLLTSKTTGESHVIVTDSNGHFSSSASKNMHTNNTNINDSALIEASDGSYSIDESKLDRSAGIWFGEGQVNDSMGALLYDSYTLEELRVEKNKKYDLITIDNLTVERVYTVDLGTINNQLTPVPTLKSQVMNLEDTSKIVKGWGQTKISDVVDVTDIKANERYKLVGSLVDKATGEVIKNGYGVEYTSELEFAVSDEKIKTNGLYDTTQNVEFTVNGTDMEGKKVVVFESLYNSDTNELIMAHESLSNVDQTFRVTSVSISTKARDKQDGDKIVLGDTASVIVDEVSISGLIVGMEYTLKAGLHNPSSGLTIVVNNKEISGETKFIAPSENYTVEVELPANTIDLAGTKAVVSEALYQGTDLIAEHNDLANADQTVTIESREPDPTIVKDVYEWESPQATENKDSTSNLPKTGDEAFLCISAIGVLTTASLISLVLIRRKIYSAQCIRK